MPYCAPSYANNRYRLTSVNGAIRSLSRAKWWRPFQCAQEFWSATYDIVDCRGERDPAGLCIIGAAEILGRRQWMWRREAARWDALRLLFLARLHLEREVMKR